MLMDKSMPCETEGNVMTPRLTMAKMENEWRIKDEE
jgi:hypothetical protein